MRKIFCMALVLAFTAAFIGLAHAGNEKPSVEAVLTAIDVADLINRGSPDPDIAESLSSQQGFDREAARNRGRTDDQIIAYLLTHTKKEDLIDENKSKGHQLAGDKYYGESQYQKAAKEYYLAIAYSKDDHALYKMRGDAYKQYLTHNLSLPGSSPGGSKEALLNRAKALLCRSVYADYKRSIEIIEEAIRKNIAEINAIKFRMRDKSSTTDPTGKASPTRSRTAQGIKDMREMRLSSYLLTTANQAQSKMQEAMSEYIQVCGKEDARRRELIKNERENTREKKWSKYMEREETKYFYDKSSIVKADGDLTIWTRRENMNDEMAYDIAKIGINCRKGTMGFIESLSYDEMGDLAPKIHQDQTTMSKVFPGTMEEALFKEVCK